MSTVIVAVALGVLLVALGLYFRIFAGWRRLHQGILGGLTLFYGMWLALFTGAVLKLVVPGVGSVMLGSAAGVGLGFLTYLAIGVVGVVTGGVGIALGALGMMVIGAVIGGVGGAVGAALVRVPLIGPLFWAPVVLVGVYLLIGAFRKKTPISASPGAQRIPSPDA